MIYPWTIHLNKGNELEAYVLNFNKLVVTYLKFSNINEMSSFIDRFVGKDGKIIKDEEFDNRFMRLSNYHRLILSEEYIEHDIDYDQSSDSVH